MRQTILGLVAALAVVTASAVPALACGGGGCSPCGPAYAAPCGQPEAYVAPFPTVEYSGCYAGCAWVRERLPDPVYQYGAHYRAPQYYYVNQGPTLTGPGASAPYPTYQEGAVIGWGGYPHHRWHHYRHYGYREHVLRRYY